MKRIYAILASMVLGLVSVCAFADGPKIGIVDLQKVMQASGQIKVIQQKLEKDFKPRRDKLIALEEGVKKDMEKFKNDNVIMSQTQKRELEKKIMAAQQKVEREGQQYQQELSTAHNEAMEEFYGRVRKAIDKVAADDKFDLIFQRDAAPFSDAKFDITPKVIEQIK